MFHYSVQATSNTWAVFHESSPFRPRPQGRQHFCLQETSEIHLLDYSTGDKLEVKVAACTLSCSWGSWVGVGCQAPKNSLFFRHRGNGGEKVSPASFHPHISLGAPSRRGPPKVSFPRQRSTERLGLTHPEPGLGRNINMKMGSVSGHDLKVRGPLFKPQPGHYEVCVFKRVPTLLDAVSGCSANLCSVILRCLY